MCWGQIVGMGAQGGQSALQGQQNADTLNANADNLEAKAADAIKRGAIAEQTQRNKGDQFLGTQRAVMGASGVDVNSGSFAKVQEQTAGMTELDAQTIRSNSLREAWGYQTEADQARSQAESAMWLTDLIAPGGKAFQKDKNVNFLLTGNPWARGFKKDYDSNRVPWKGL